jgi:hypothetical protein
MKSFFVKGITSQGLDEDGATGYVTLDIEGDEPFELRIPMGAPVAQLIEVLLDQSNAAGPKQRAHQGASTLHQAIPVPMRPSDIGVAAAGNEVALSFHFGSLRLLLPVPSAQVRSIAESLVTAAGLKSGPGSVH